MHVDALYSTQAAGGPFVREIDARVKLVFGLCCLSLSVGSPGMYVPVFAGVVCAVLLGAARVSGRALLLRAAEPLAFAVFVALVQTFLVKGDVFASFTLAGYTLTATHEGLARGLYIVARVFGAVMVVLFLTMTTPADRLLSAAAWLRVPRGFVEILMFAYRYVFVLVDDAVTVYNAQMGRLGYAGFARGASSLGTLAGAVFFRAFSQAEATGISMAQRGYTGSYVPSYRGSVRVADVALLGGIAAAVSAVFVWTS